MMMSPEENFCILPIDKIFIQSSLRSDREANGPGVEDIGGAGNTLSPFGDTARRAIGACIAGPRGIGSGIDNFECGTDFSVLSAAAAPDTHSFDPSGVASGVVASTMGSHTAPTFSKGFSVSIT